MTRNYLSRGEQRQLEDLVLAEKDKIAASRWTMGTLAKEGEKRLKRPVTNGNIAATSKAVGVPWPAHTGPKAAKSLRECQASIVYLAREMAQLMGELGKPVPPQLACMAVITTEETAK